MEAAVAALARALEVLRERVQAAETAAKAGDRDETAQRLALVHAAMTDVKRLTPAIFARE